MSDLNSSSNRNYFLRCTIRELVLLITVIGVLLAVVVWQTRPNGADPAFPGSDGQTPYDYAEDRQRTELSQLLKSADGS